MELYVSWIKQSGTLWMKWLRIKGPFQSKCHRCGLKNKLIPPLPIQLSLVWKFNLSHLNVANLSFQQSHRSQLKLNLWWFSEYFHFQLFEEEGKRVGGWWLFVSIVEIYLKHLSSISDMGQIGLPAPVIIIIITQSSSSSKTFYCFKWKSHSTSYHQG